ncbi:Bug family tripartite tricarboxylate transporter substrate binding protein [Ornithinimicrobium cavernae]|uniref:Bug family tripartite tricarboxylate transporter substrate binding protein n=1 Tax=Ornithinimicrobium cavernae TaxID=2666047 RepID=UPI000D69505B|nr:tripartite tricarboxylate transporter substrate binding protein [Ornithinimicrobium cavernae]
MRTTRLLTVMAAVVSVTLLSACGGSAGGQEGSDGLPDGQLTFIVPYGPGGSTDNISRIFVEHLEKQLDRPIVVENVEGGGGVIGMTETMQSDPDGLTIGLGTNTALTFQPLVSDGLAWGSTDDYSVFGAMGETPVLAISSTASGIETLDDFVTEAEARPGEISVGTTGANTLAHISAAQLENQLGIDLNIVHFPSAAEAVTAAVGGHIDAYLTTPSSAQAMVEAGEVNGLAILNEQVPEGLDVPSAVEEGIDPVISFTVYVIAPKGLPEAVATELEEATVAVLKDPAYQKAVAGEGAFPGAIGAEEANADLGQEQKTMQALVDLMD